MREREIKREGGRDGGGESELREYVYLQIKGEIETENKQRYHSINRLKTSKQDIKTQLVQLRGNISMQQASRHNSKKLYQIMYMHEWAPKELHLAENTTHTTSIYNIPYTIYHIPHTIYHIPNTVTRVNNV